MKKLYFVLYSIILLCIVGSAVFLTIMPDTVPVHYNFAGEADRFGSKFENLIWPFFTAAWGAFISLLARQQRKKGVTANEKVLLYTGVCTASFFTVMGFYFMLRALQYDAVTAAGSMDLMKLTGIGVGAVLVVLGNIMPKSKRNAFFGLRTAWSMANDRVWQKSQRFGGIAAVICGFCMIILSVLLPWAWNLAMIAAVLLIWITLCIAASYRYFKGDAGSSQ